jgi:hypothetical protein
MASGYAAYIINDIVKATGPNAQPNFKVDARGLTKLLYQGNGSNPIRNTIETGEKREIRYFYRQRANKSQVLTSASNDSHQCDYIQTPARLETTLTATNTVKIAYHLPYSLMTNYEHEANMPAKIGSYGSATQELLDLIKGAANGLLEKMNETLWTSITWGVNSVAGNNSATTVDFPQNAALQKVTAGMPKIISDYKRNGLSGMPNIVTGAGIPFQWLSFSNAMGAAAANGFDNRIATAWGDWFLDQDASSADGLYTFEPGSIQIVEYLENLFRPGRLGVSEFFTIALPTVDPLGNSVAVPFDCQIREVDCPTTLYDSYSGSSGTYDRGLSLIMWKNFGLFQLPPNSYRGEDQQYGVNGSMRYTITNAAATFPTS